MFKQQETFLPDMEVLYYWIIWKLHSLESLKTSKIYSPGITFWYWKKPILGIFSV